MKNEEKFINIIEDVTAITQEKLSEEKFKEKLKDIIEKETSINVDEAKQTINNISSTIDSIADNFESLQKAKKEGKSRTIWLKDRLDDTVEKFKIEKTEKFIGEIKESLQKSNAKIGVEVFGKEIDISEPLTNPKYDDLNKTAIVNDFQNEIKNNTLLGAVVFENGKIKIDKDHKEIKAVKDYFEAKLDAPQDKSFKKAISAAVIIGQKKEMVPPVIIKKPPEEIAMIVDKGVTSAKVAYKLGKGELSPLDAVEYTIDRNVAVLNSAITTTCTRVGSIVGGAVGGVIGSVFGPVGTVAGAAVGTVVGKIAGYGVGKYVGEGIKKVASAAKSVCKSAWEGVKSVASSLNPFNWF